MFFGGWVGGWMVESKSHSKDCLQHFKKGRKKPCNKVITERLNKDQSQFFVNENSQAILLLFNLSNQLIFQVLSV